MPLFATIAGLNTLPSASVPILPLSKIIQAAIDAGVEGLFATEHDNDPGMPLLSIQTPTFLTCKKSHWWHLPLKQADHVLFVG